VEYETRKKQQEKGKHLFVVKSDQRDSLRFREKSLAETRNIYVIRTDEEIVNKYSGILERFVDEGGLLLLVTGDKFFFKNFKIAIVNELQLGYEQFHCCTSVDDAKAWIKQSGNANRRLLLLLESHIRRTSSIDFVREVRGKYPAAKIMILSEEVNRDRLFLFHEEGAHGFLLKPACPNVIIQKLAFALKPQAELDALIEEGKRLISLNKFELAIDVARAVLASKPGSPAGLLIMGDALKGLCNREEALRAYKSAADNAKYFLDPLKRIVRFHLEDNNEREVLKYMIKLDHLSPLNLDRKVKIGEFHMRQGEPDKAQEYFDNALTSARTEGGVSVVCEMSMSIGKMLLEKKPELALKYFRKAMATSRDIEHSAKMRVFNYIGITLRKKGMWKESVSAYQEAVTLAPDDEHIHYNLSLAYFEGCEYSKAKKHIETALSINPGFHKNDPEILYNIATTLFKGGKMKEAKTYAWLLESVHGRYKDSSNLIKTIEGVVHE
jgi:tetratricopeptide (TPR) repeat protein